VKASKMVFFSFSFSFYYYYYYKYVKVSIQQVAQLHSRH
jgi:hypothetical protein